MGPSGSGKSTLMHLLAGLDRPTAGTVRDRRRRADRRWTTSELTELRREHIGFIFQSFNLLPVLNAEENILLPLSIAGREARHASGSTGCSTTVGLGDRLSAPARPSSPAASSSASRSRAR